MSDWIVAGIVVALTLAYGVAVCIIVNQSGQYDQEDTLPELDDDGAFW